MTALGILLIATGVTLVCAGLVFRSRVPPIDPVAQIALTSFAGYSMLLDEGDRRDENRD